MKIFLIFVWLTILTYLSPSKVLLAASPPACSPATVGIPCFEKNPITQPWFRPGSSDKPSDFLTTIFDNRILLAVYTILGSLAVLLLILAGIQYITAAGNAEKIKKARQSILQIILGIVVLASSYAIIALILGLANFLARQSPP